VTTTLVGRDAELRQTEAFGRSLADGGAALVLAGGAGIGKTALWRAAIDNADGELTVVQTRCAEVEMPIALGALSDLLGGLVGNVSRELTAPQHSALDVAFGVAAAEANARPDWLALARATLATLELAARERTLLLAIDDVQWLDPASRRVLAFALRRTAAFRVGLLATARIESGRPDHLSLADAYGPDRYTVLSLGPLSPGALQRLLRVQLGVYLPRPTLARIHAASGGNPMFALEFARLELAAQPTGRASPLAIPDSLDQLVETRMAALPDDLLPVVRAASALERPTLPVLRGVLPPRPPVDELVEAATRAGALASEGETLRFAHPLLASAAYFGMTPAERRDLHGRLAGLVDGLEEQARHAALAAGEPDADVARLVARAADDAARRGALDAAAALAAEAARIEPDADARRRLVLGACEHLIDTGEFASARDRLDGLLEEGVPTALRGRALLLRAESEIRNRRLLVQLLEEAHAHADDPQSQWQAAIRIAQHVAWISGDAARAVEFARRALDAAQSLDDPELVVESEAAVAYYEAATGRRPGMPDPAAQVPPLLRFHLPWWHFGAGLSLGNRLLWAGAVDEARRVLEAEHAALSGAGREARAAFALLTLAEVEWRAGRWERVEELAEEATDVLGDLILTAFPRLLLWTGRGLADEARTLGEDMLGWAEPLSDLHHPPRVQAALGLLELSRGDLEAARIRLADALERLDDVGIGHLGYATALPDLVEALAGLGRLDEASAAADRLERDARRVDVPWVDAMAARARGVVLLAQGDADSAARNAAGAAAAFAALGTPLEEARARLTAGSALRRLGERSRAAAELEAAAATLERLGAPLWLERAEQELRRARPRRGHDRGELTAAERRVAALVAAGHTNKEVGAELFTTVATVEAHLTRIYRKLGVRSRSELTKRVAEGTLELDAE
jgi:DNA-binding CsgD family transcriptional regulator